MGKSLGGALLQGAGSAAVGGIAYKVDQLQKDAAAARTMSLESFKQGAMSDRQTAADTAMEERNVSQFDRANSEKVAGYDSETFQPLTRKDLADNPNLKNSMLSEAQAKIKMEETSYQKGRGRFKDERDEAMTFKLAQWDKQEAGGAFDKYSKNQTKAMKAAYTLGVNLPKDAKVEPPTAAMIEAAKEIAQGSKGWEKLSPQEQMTVVDNYAWGLSMKGGKVGPSENSGQFDREKDLVELQDLASSAAKGDKTAASELDRKLAVVKEQLPAEEYADIEKRVKNHVKQPGVVHSLGNSDDRKGYNQKSFMSDNGKDFNWTDDAQETLDALTAAGPDLEASGDKPIIGNSAYDNWKRSKSQGFTK